MKAKRIENEIRDIKDNPPDNYVLENVDGRNLTFLVKSDVFISLI